MDKGYPLEMGGTCASLPGGCMRIVHGDPDGHGRPGKERGQAAGVCVLTPRGVTGAFRCWLWETQGG